MKLSSSAIALTAQDMLTSGKVRNAVIENAEKSKCSVISGNKMERSTFLFNKNEFVYCMEQSSSCSSLIVTTSPSLTSSAAQFAPHATSSVYTSVLVSLSSTSSVSESPCKKEPDKISGETSLLDNNDNNNYSIKSKMNLRKNLIHNTFAIERPKRKRKMTTFFEPSVEERDHLIRAAIKKSIIDKKHLRINYEEDISEVPTIYPTEEEFSNPICIWEKYEHIGLKYGAIKLIPPQGWKPPFSLNLDSLQFQVREQHLHKLSTGTPFNHPERVWTIADLTDLNKETTEKFFGENSNPSTLNVEEVYWDIVETGNIPVSVYYAADLKTNELGSGFPQTKESEYALHAWNLTRISRSDGSLFKYYFKDVPGITSPWLYIGMIFSCFCWHTEDNFFAAVNYQHFGAPKVWYIIPSCHAMAVEKLLKNYASTKKNYYAVHSLTVQLPPSIYISNRIPIYKIVQRENEYVLLWPRTFHAGFNTGFNCNEACNVAPTFWLQWGHMSIDIYRYMRSTCIPPHELLFLAISCYTEFTHHRLLHIIKALLQMFFDEYGLRSSLHMFNAPLYFSEKQVQKLKNDMSTNPNGAELSLYFNELQSLSEKPVHHELSHDEMFRQVAHLSKLPSKDCGNCQTPCHAGCVVCIHSKDIVCRQCVEAHTCKCDSK